MWASQERGIKQLGAGSCTWSKQPCSILEHALPHPFSWEYDSNKAPKAGLLQGWQLGSPQNSPPGARHEGQCLCWCRRGSVAERVKGEVKNPCDPVLWGFEVLTVACWPLVSHWNRWHTASTLAWSSCSSMTWSSASGSGRSSRHQE